MELSLKTLFPGLNPKATRSKQILDVYTPRLSNRLCFSAQTKYAAQKHGRSWESRKHVFAACAVLEGTKDVNVSSSPPEHFVVTTDNTNDSRKLKIRVEVSGAKTQEIFDHVFCKMVAAAQPIPGFHQVKGGKTPNIGRDVLLSVLGPTKVNKNVIQNIINTAVAEYVRKEGLRVTKKLRVEQSFEDLVDAFSPNEKFSFSAVLSLRETK